MNTISNAFYELNKGIRLFPNPTSSKLTFEVENHLGHRLKVQDITGKVVLVQELGTEQTTISVANWAKVMYFYEIETQNGQLIGSDKFIVK